MSTKATPAEKLAMVVTPVFNVEMGDRLRIARMAMGIDQRELGRLLGIDQRIVCQLERGRQHVVRSVPLSRWQAILGKHATFVFIGSNLDKYNAQAIKLSYWEKHGSGKWKRGGSDK